MNPPNGTSSASAVILGRLRNWAVLVLFYACVILTACSRPHNQCVPTEHPASSTKANILLFSGTGISPCDVVALEDILESNHLSYATINSAGLNGMNAAQFGKYKLLIIPGGNFIDMGKSLNPATATNIRTAVDSGLNYLGICAGAFLAGKSAYYSGFNLTWGTTFHFYSAASKGLSKTAVAITTPDGKTLDHYWENGPQLSGWGAVMGKYPDGTPAITQGQCGKGMVLLTGIHAEAPEYWRGDIDFKTSAATDNAYAATLIKAALNGKPLPHF